MPLPRRPPRPRARTAPRARRARAVRRAPVTVPSAGATAWSGRSAFTSRAAVLAVVVCAVLLSLAYPLREYVAQRGEIERLQAQHRATDQRIAALRRQQQQWADPAYITTQARQRLHFVLPGETAFVVLGPHHPAGRDHAQRTAAQPGLHHHAGCGAPG